MRINQLTFTRFLAAMAIVVYHYGTQVAPFNSPSVYFLFHQANIGVSYFFMLSGFVMIVAYHKKEVIPLVDFYKKRLVRIYPVYFLGLLGALLYILVYNLPLGYSSLILNLGLVQVWVPDSALSINFPGWSLSVEVFFYFVFPFIFNYAYIKASRIRKSVIIIILLLFAGSQVFLHCFVYSPHYHGVLSGSHSFIYYNPLLHLNQFLVGNLAGLFFVRLPKSAFKSYGLVLLGLLVTMVAALRLPVGLIFVNGLFAFLFLPFIVLLSLNRGPLTKLLCSRPLVFLGEISFAVYIFQSPVFSMVKMGAQKMNLTNPQLLFWGTTAILIGVSAISYIYFEKPMRNWFLKAQNS